MISAGRLAKAEKLQAEREAAASAALLSEFDDWRAAHWSAAESELWTRHLLSQPVPDGFYAGLSMTRAEAERIMADYAPLTADEDHCLELAVSRAPAELLTRLWSADTAAALGKLAEAEAVRVEIRGIDYDAAAPGAVVAMGTRPIDYRAGLAQLAPAGLDADAPGVVSLALAEVAPDDSTAGGKIQEPDFHGAVKIQPAPNSNSALPLEPAPVEPKSQVNTLMLPAMVASVTPAPAAPEPVRQADPEPAGLAAINARARERGESYWAAQMSAMDSDERASW